MLAAIGLVFCIVRQSQVANTAGDRWKPVHQSFAFHDGAGVHAGGTVHPIRLGRLVVEPRRPPAQQSAISPRGRISDTPRIDADDRNSLAQQAIDARESTAAQSHDTDVSMVLAAQRRIWRAGSGGRVPERRRLTQKYVAKDASRRANSLRLLNRSYSQPRTNSNLITDSLVGLKLMPAPACRTCCPTASESRSMASTRALSVKVLPGAVRISPAPMSRATSRYHPGCRVAYVPRTPGGRRTPVNCSGPRCSPCLTGSVFLRATASRDRRGTRWSGTPPT